MNEQVYLTWLKQRLSSKRLTHSLGVADIAVELAHIYGYDPQITKITALLHDCAKDLTDVQLLKQAQQFGIMVTGIEGVAPSLLHGPVGARLAQKAFSSVTEGMATAITYHTTGRPGMTKLEQIIYVADIIEPGRAFPGVFKLRQLVGRPLYEVTRSVMDHVLQYLLAEGMPIDTRTILARNELCLLAGALDK